MPSVHSRRLHHRGLQSDVVIGVVASNYTGLRRVSRALRGSGFEIAGLACETSELVLEASGAHLDVVVLFLDDDLEELSTSIALLRKRLGEIGIVAVMRSTRPHDIRRALDAGADGIVIEGQLQLVLPLTVRNVCAGQLSVPAEARAHVTHEVLTYFERQVLDGVRAGLTNREIAARLKVSQSTVKGHLSRTFRKLGVRSREEAATAVLDDDQRGTPL